MLYQQIARRLQDSAPVRAAVIGAGRFGAGIVTHARYVPALRICAIADPDLAASRLAYHQAGISDEQIAVCESAAEAPAATHSGKYIIAPSADPLFAQPIDVIVEATGIPEAGARHARDAIATGKHVAMVNKEADVTVGPILKHLADRAGLVYTAVEGDQHGMLISLVTWARVLGLEILSGGKALDDELIVEGDAICRYGKRMPLDGKTSAAFEPTFSRDALAFRSAFLGPLAGAKPWDIVELTIAANATGLVPDVPRLHCPTCWTGEIPALLCPSDMGGILSRTGVIDAVQVIRRRHEASMGGGVFIIFRRQGDAMRKSVNPDRMTCSPTGETAMIVRPHHLLGIEAIGTILSAALAKTPTGALDYNPRFDVIYRTLKPLAAGETVGHDHSPELAAEMIPAVQLAPGLPLPAEMARGNRLLRDVAEGAVITGADVARPADSALWQLREEQDQHFRV